MSDREQGDSCTFIFKKSRLKSRGSRKRRNSVSEEGSCKILALDFVFTLFLVDESDSDTQPSVVRPTKRKGKHNPNVQSTSAILKRQKQNASSNESSSGEEHTAVSYKSKRSALPEGPQDQGATAVLVCHFFFKSFVLGNAVLTITFRKLKPKQIVMRKRYLKNV